MKLFPAALSFLLPGLGQLYTGNAMKAVAFFSVFVAGVFSPKLTGLITLTVLLAPMDVYFLSRPKEQPRDLSREFLFSFCAVLGLFAWMGVMIPVPILP